MSPGWVGFLCGIAVGILIGAVLGMKMAVTEWKRLRDMIEKNTEEARRRRGVTL